MTSLDLNTITLFACTTYTVYRILWFVMKKTIKYFFIDNETDYPPCATNHCDIFSCFMQMPCNISAKAVFLLFTGIDLDILTKNKMMTHNHVGLYDFDDSYESHKRPVCYIEFMWNTSIPAKSVRILEYHALVYHDGYLYQSFRTQRYRWFNRWMDAYPMTRMFVKPKYRHYFNDFKGIRSFNAKMFNKLCAPSTHPILVNNEHFRCVTFYRASLNPTRSNIELYRNE
jgi:hypothetical protein